MKTHYTIPIFIPEKACPFRCVYCNQYHITNKSQTIDKEEIRNTIERYLATFPKDAVKKIAFFGGTFTGMDIAEQNHYLEVAHPYIESGQVAEIQLSTRPDYIDEAILENLKRYGVGTIELGAQSLDEEVLRCSGRGHSVADVERAAKLVRDYGFTLGLQMMLGLPLDTKEKSVATARKIVELGAQCTRIYPTLVIKDTYLEKMHQQAEYQPLDLPTAIDWALAVMEVFEEAGVTILRVGLHPSEGLLDGSQLVAGPFHVSFKELVLTEKWNRILQDFCAQSGDAIEICVPAAEINAAIGYGGRNRKMLEKHYKKVRIRGI